MQFADVLCYIFLTITVTASCIGADEQKSEIESQPERKLSKRDTTVLIDNFPMDRIFQKPKVIYRRLSKQRYGPPKPKYGPPRLKYRPPRPTRKPAKTRKPKPTKRPKYGVPSSKKRGGKPKPKYGPPKTKPSNPAFGHVVKMPHYSYFSHDNVGFGEPPSQMIGSYQQPQQNYGEPPVDSYGAPLKASIKDVYPTSQSFQETTHHFNILDFNEYESWNHHKDQDANYAYSKQQSTISIPRNPIFVTPEPKEFQDSSSEPTNDKQIMKENKVSFRKRRPQFLSDTAKIVNRPWRPSKYVEFDDEIIVGGQYAEPPARFVPKLPNTPMNDDDEDPIFALNGFDEATSAQQHSAYSNYKNSNMAFSPQNLNDAFSIVDK